MIANQILDIPRGNSVAVDVTLTNAADGSSYDATVPGIFVEWRLATSSYGTTLVRKISPDDITLSPTGVSFNLYSEETDLKPREYYHELKVTDGEDEYTAMVGTVLIRRSMKAGGTQVVALIASSPPTVKIEPAPT